jgi:phosphohistidine phosphatase
LLRHAKSSWDDPALPDRDRPLAPRGIKAARRIAGHMQASGIRPELVLCSSARRTRDTLALLEPALDAEVAVEIEEQLYGADAADLIERLRRVDEGLGSAMLIGHNPALQDLGIELAGGGDAEALAQLHAKFPTAALATLDLGSGGWAELDPGTASLTSLVLPRRLG